MCGVVQVVCRPILAIYHWVFPPEKPPVSGLYQLLDMNRETKIYMLVRNLEAGKEAEVYRSKQDLRNLIRRMQEYQVEYNYTPENDPIQETKRVLTKMLKKMTPRGRALYQRLFGVDVNGDHLEWVEPQARAQQSIDTENPGGAEVMINVDVHAGEGASFKNKNTNVKESNLQDGGIGDAADTEDKHQVEDNHDHTAQQN